MADLYKGIEGSPITYLAADISAGQTTISIADDTALPDAPNIATIGFGENVETIKYGQKSNGVLQEVVRGVEGIPRAWQAGTEVARFFTAYDHNSIIENFNAHLAESVTQDAHGWSSATRFKIGHFVRPINTSAGTQAITGLGFKPKAIIALATVQLVEGAMSIGMWAEGGSSMGLFDTYKNVANSYGKGGLVHIRLGAYSYYDYSCSVQSVNNDGFTLVWNKGSGISGGGTIEVIYLAFR